MSLQAERSILETAFQSSWGSTTPVKYDNVPFKTPDGTPWVRFTVSSGNGSQVSLGPDALYRYVGIVGIMVMVPNGSGTDVCRQLADQAARIFWSKEFGNAQSGRIVCFTPDIKPVGEVADGWYQINVIVPYWRDVRI